MKSFRKKLSGYSKNSQEARQGSEAVPSVSQLNASQIWMARFCIE